jgi:hypothetical protein
MYSSTVYDNSVVHDVVVDYVTVDDDDDDDNDNK